MESAESAVLMTVDTITTDGTTILTESTTIPVTVVDAAAVVVPSADASVIDATVIPDVTLSETDRAIIKQVEFYFSDSNLPRDRHLRALYDAAPDHFVALSDIASYKRMTALTTDMAVIQRALAIHTADPAHTIKLNGTATAVTRVLPLPDQVNVTAQTVHVGNIPLTATLDDITAEMNRLSDSAVVCVRMHRTAVDRTFDGSAFVEMKTPEIAQTLAALKSAEWKGPGAVDDAKPLTIQTKTQYFQTADIADEQPRTRGTKRKQSEISGDKAAAAAVDGDSKTNEDSAVDNDNGHDAEDDADGDDDADVTFVPDLLIKFDTVNTAETSRESLHDYVTAYGGNVSYTDYSKTEVEAVVRLHDDSAIKASALVAAMSAADAPHQLDGVTPTVRVLSGDEEQAYWNAVKKRMAEKKAERSSSRGNRRGGRGRGGRGRGRGGRGGRGRGGRGDKRQKRD